MIIEVSFRLEIRVRVINRMWVQVGRCSDLAGGPEVWSGNGDEARRPPEAEVAPRHAEVSDSEQHGVLLRVESLLL